jgi:hypothetical protein
MKQKPSRFITIKKKKIDLNKNITQHSREYVKML